MVIADKDQQPGLRTLVIPRMLARGRTPEDVVAITGVPRALVDLIAANTAAFVHDPFPLNEAHATTVPPRRTRHHNRDRQIRVLAFAIFATGCLGNILLHAPLLPFAVMIAGALVGRSPPPARKLRNTAALSPDDPDSVSGDPLPAGRTPVSVHAVPARLAVVRGWRT